MDDPMMIAAAGAAVTLVLFLVARQQKQKKAKNQIDGTNKKANKGKKSSAKKGKQKAQEIHDDADDEEAHNEEVLSEEWQTSAASASVVDDSKVSVQDVDPLTEFNVYKQFGYYDKAAESLALYLSHQNHVDPKMAAELVELWSSAKKADAVADALNLYKDLFSKDELATYIKGGLALDSNNLALHVLAESSLGWSVRKIAEEMGEKPVELATQESRSPLKSRKQTEAQDSAKMVKKPLVLGNSVLGNVGNDEKEAVLAFSEPEVGVKLLKNSLSYEAAIKYLNRAIRVSRRPAALLIDALTLDYRANNINNFASHLWNLYNKLGQNGRQVKERMLGWGYSLGNHEAFMQLETNMPEPALREYGIKQGFVDGVTSQKKSFYKNLVIENTDVDVEPRTPSERLLKEAESLLMYGQLDSSMDLLEEGILEYPQEAQLYIYLFDLYERAEEWERLEKLLQQLRNKVQSLPEEVVLAMGQLLQRINTGLIGR